MKMNDQKFYGVIMITGTLLLAGCATRPERQVGGPPPSRPLPPALDSTRPDRRADMGTRPRTTVILDDEEIVPITVTGPAVPPRAAPAPAPAPQPREGTSYTIKRGETLSAIAARHRISWRELADYNRIVDPDSVRAGQVILIPPGATGTAARTAPASERRETPTPAPTPVIAGEGTYVVQPGDNLTVIARRHDITVGALRQVNNLTGDRIVVGQTLKLPEGTSGAPRTSTTTTTTPRETPRETPAETIRDTPRRPTPQPAPIDRDVRLPDTPDRTEPAPAPSGPDFTILVEAGDTLKSISDSYVIPLEDLRRINNLGPNDEVREGDRLQIPPTTW